MDLSLPRFASLEDGALPKAKLWTITEKPLSSPVSVRDGNRSRTPSPCFQLDDLSSVSSTGNTSTNDFNMDTARSITPVGSIVFSSEEDAPLIPGQEDRRKVQRRELSRNDQPGPTDVQEYVPEPRERPVDAPKYTPTPRDRPVTVSTMGEKPVGALRHNPMLRAWPVDDRIFEPKANLRPVGVQTIRERPGGEKPYGLRPRERPVAVPKPNDRPVDGVGNKPAHRERPAGAGTLELIDERPVVDRKFTGQPVDEQGEKPTENEKRTPVTDNRPVADPRLSIRPVDVVAFERMPRYVQVDNESILGRPIEGEKSHPSTDGVLADKPNAMIGPKEGTVVQETVTRPYHVPPPSDGPEGANGEVMPLIIIENKPEEDTTKMTDGRVPVSLDILVPH